MGTPELIVLFVLFVVIPGTIVAVVIGVIALTNRAKRRNDDPRLAPPIPPPLPATPSPHPKAHPETHLPPPPPPPSEGDLTDL